MCIRTLEPKGGFTLRRYETILIADANLPNDDLNGLIERYKSIITNLKGLIVKVEEWGKRKLADEIKKQSRGSYVLSDYVAKSNVVDELERNFKIDDKILKFLTVKKSDSVDLNKVEEEIAATKKVEKPDVSPSASGETVPDSNSAADKIIIVKDPRPVQDEAPVASEASEQKVDAKGEKE
jgi:small subunit ribosomal protein S6